MENTYEIITIPAIVAVVYVIMAIYKKTVSGQASIWTNLIPMWGALLGAILGCIVFCASPELIPADNVLIAIIIGLSSGLCATGVNQVGKQLKQLDIKVKDKTTTTTTAVTLSDNTADNTETK